jgi:hypothetical protein
MVQFMQRAIQDRCYYDAVGGDIDVIKIYRIFAV